MRKLGVFLKKNKNIETNRIPRIIMVILSLRTFYEKNGLSKSVRRNFFIILLPPWFKRI